MANEFTTSTDFVGYAKVTASSAQSAFPVANVVDYRHPNRPWKATAQSTSEAVVIDFGVTMPLWAVVLDNVNASSIKVQGNATDSWGAPTYTQTIDTTEDVVDSRRKKYVNLSATSFYSTGYRFLRVVSNTVGTTDGQSVFQIGSILPLGSVNTWLSNAGFPFEITALKATVANDNFGGGGREPLGIGNRYAQLTLTAPVLPIADNPLLQTLFALGEEQPILFYRNDSGFNEDVYICYRIGPTPIAQLGPNHIGFTRLVFEEVC